MSKPTQAQIEAAARAICIEQGAFDPDESTDDRKDWKIYEKAAIAALTAAAEVGEQYEPDEMCLRVGHKWVIECQRCGKLKDTAAAEVGKDKAIEASANELIEQLGRERDIKLSTIERCAQVAESSVPTTDGGMAYVKAIAAAIRALKDQL